MLQLCHHVIDDLFAREVEKRLHESLPRRYVAVVICIGKWNREQFRFSAAFHNGTNSTDKIMQTVINDHGSIGRMVGQDAMGKHWKRSEERRVGKECRSRWSP